LRRPAVGAIAITIARIHNHIYTFSANRDPVLLIIWALPVYGSRIAVVRGPPQSSKAGTGGRSGLILSPVAPFTIASPGWQQAGGRGLRCSAPAATRTLVTPPESGPLSTGTDSDSSDSKSAFQNPLWTALNARRTSRRTLEVSLPSFNSVFHEQMFRHTANQKTVLSTVGLSDRAT